MKTGMEISMIEIVSMKQPSSSTMACIAITSKIGAMTSAPTHATSEEVAPLAASNCPKPVEPTITKSIIAEVVMVDIIAFLSASHVRRR